MVHSFLFSAIIFSLLMALFPSFRQPFVQMTTSFLSGMTGGGCFGKNCGGSRYVCKKPGIHGYALTILKQTSPNDFESMSDACSLSLDLRNEFNFLECSWNHEYFGPLAKKCFALTLQESLSIYDSMNRPKNKCIAYIYILS